MAKEIKETEKNKNPELKKFMVQIREVHTQDVEVFAKDHLDAIRRVEEGDGDQVEETLTYSHTLDSDEWWIAGPNNEIPQPCTNFLSEEETEKSEEN